MAVLTKTNVNATAPVVVTLNTLTASDTFTYDAAKKTFLVLRNATAGALSPVITGSGATAPFVPGYGSASIAGGYTGFGSIAAGAAKAIELTNLNVWLQGTITITGGAGIIAEFLEY